MTEFGRSPLHSTQELADAAQLASLADETSEGRSIVVLAKERYGIRARDMAALNATFVAREVFAGREGFYNAGLTHYGRMEARLFLSGSITC